MVRVAQWIVAVAALLVPVARRSDWRREWHAELAHAARTASRGRLLRRSLLSLGDALVLRGRGAARPATRRRAGLADGVWSDARYAVRSLSRSPGFATVALATFGLGIGVNATVFAAVDAVLFRPLSYADEAGLVEVEAEPGASVSKSTLVALRERTSAFDGLAGWSRWGFTWTGDGPAQLVTGVSSTADLFEVLGVVPARGRLFRAGDDRPGADPVVVVSHGFWRSRLGGDAAAIGRTVELNGVARTIVGVTAAGFAFPDGEAHLFVPLTLDPADASDWSAGYLRVLGRLRRNMAPIPAQDQVRAALSAHASETGGTEGFGAEARLRSLREALVGDARAPLLALLCAVGFVLLVACANLANLLVARTTGRGDELAVRRALGASRGRIARQLLVESAVLATAGAAVGLLLARAGLAVVNTLLPRSLPGAGAVALDARVAGATVLAAVIAGLAAGLPGLRGAGVSVSRDRAGGPRRGVLRLQATLLAAEVALAVVLVASAGLSLEAVRTLLRRDSGYATEGVLTVIALPPAGRYAEPAALRAYWDEALSAVRAIPGATSAGAVHLAPFGGSDWNPELVVEDRPVAPGERRPEVGWRVVSPGWFETAGIPLLEGRVFDGRDRADGAGVAVVSETLARRMWPEGSAVGRRVRTFFEGGAWVEVVGVVADTRDVALHRATRPQIYRPYAQYTPGSMMVAVRSPMNEAALAEALRTALHSIDEDVPLTDLRPFDARVSSSVGRERLVARLLGVFAALALVLGAVGIYGVASYSVSRRRRELGVRAALGAGRSDLVTLILGGAARVTALGAAAGLALAVAAARIASSRIPNLPRQNPLLLAASALVLMAVALLAAWLPARRAGRTDPQRTLRDD